MDDNNNSNNINNNTNNNNSNNNKDRRIKREIANSNERRRMQSINAGFQKLKRLLPVNDGEKISKANILQHAANFITTIERDRIALHEQNTLIKRILLDLKSGKQDLGSALDTINSATANKALPTIPLNPHVMTTSSANTTPISSPTPQTTPTPTLPNATTTTKQTKTTLKTTTKQTKTTIKTTTKQTKTTIKSKTNCIDNNDTMTATPTIATRKYPTGPKAAIALPLEVPYTSEESAPKGQTLDTICKAIMEIEGDRVFKSEKIDQEINNTEGTCS
uniref:Transcription factor AP-4 n=1 Tax=Aceria tosichella TaxID=561515 RepID=A0A6G1SBG6_9ACAR